MKDEDYLKIAKEDAEKYSTENTKVGCVILYENYHTSSGVNFKIYNDNSKNHSERMDEVVHAEMNALFNRVYDFETVNTVYVYPTICESICCVECAKHLIAFGVKRIVGYKCDSYDSRWKEQSDRALKILNKANVKIEFI